MSQQHPLAGIPLLMTALFLFSIQDVVIKSFSGDYSVLQIVFIRGAVGLSILLIFLGLRPAVKFVRSKKPWLAMARGLLGFTSYVGYYMAMASLPMAQVVAILFTAPIFVTILSALLLKEQVGVRRWTAVLIGFVGVVIVVGPSDFTGNIAIVLALLASITYASSTVITRYLSPHDPPLTITLYSMAVFVAGSTVLGVLVGLGSDGVASHVSIEFFVRPWALPTTIDWLLMIFLGLNWCIGMYLLAKTYTLAPASLLAPFEYTYIVWAVLFGYLFWSEVPPPTTLLGVAVLISSSIYIARRELRVQKTVRDNGLEIPREIVSARSPM